jgi:hypothetical protein
VGAELFHADGRTDTTKVAVAFSQFCERDIQLAVHTSHEPDNRRWIPVSASVFPLDATIRGALGDTKTIKLVPTAHSIPDAKGPRQSS